MYSHICESIYGLNMSTVRNGEAGAIICISVYRPEVVVLHKYV